MNALWPILVDALLPIMVGIVGATILASILPKTKIDKKTKTIDACHCVGFILCFYGGLLLGHGNLFGAIPAFLSIPFITMREEV
jgi:hypothetical protein